jgi:hypothetical protein
MQTPIVDEYSATRIAQSIRTAAEMGKRLNSCGLNRRAVVILLQDATGVAQRDIKLILDALPKLSAFYLTAPNPPSRKP